MCRVRAARRDDEGGVAGQAPLGPHLRPVVGALGASRSSRRRCRPSVASSPRPRARSARARSPAAASLAQLRASSRVQRRGHERRCRTAAPRRWSCCAGRQEPRGRRVRRCPRAAAAWRTAASFSRSASTRALTSPVWPPQAPQSRPAACGLLALWLPWPASSTSGAKPSRQAHRARGCRLASRRGRGRIGVDQRQARAQRRPRWRRQTGVLPTRGRLRGCGRPSARSLAP